MATTNKEIPSILDGLNQKMEQARCKAVLVGADLKSTDKDFNQAWEDFLVAEKNYCNVRRLYEQEETNVQTHQANSI